MLFVMRCVMRVSCDVVCNKLWCVMCDAVSCVMDVCTETVRAAVCNV